MRTSLLASLALVAGCAGSLGSIDHETQARYDALARETPARVDEPLFAGAATLDRAALIAAVLARNPDLEAARQGWRAAIAEVPAATAFDDPMLEVGVAPLSIGSDAPFGVDASIAEKLPWPGRRRLAGEVALAEADAARGDYDALRLDTAVMTSQLFDDDYRIARELEVNDHHRALVEQMKASAEARYASGSGAPQDSLAAEVELGRLEHERVMLEGERDDLIARLDGLLHRAPDAALPPPPGALPLPPEPAPLADLLARAAHDRPEAAGARARLRGSLATVAQARRANRPDVELMTGYSSMPQMPEHRWTVGISLDLPVLDGRRRAERAAAEARQAQADAEVAALDDRVRVEVASARRDVMVSLHLVTMYDQQLLPAARDEVDAALAGYVAGQSDFTTVVAAERDLRDVELDDYRARAELWQRDAALDRAIGVLPGGGS